MAQATSPLQINPAPSAVRIASIPPLPDRGSDLALTRQAYVLLKVAFVAAPILAGLDKFFHVLVNWDQYLAPQVAYFLGYSGHTLMPVAGVIEIIAGIGVAFKPRIFAPIVGVWLVAIILNLLLRGQFYDIALRDVGLALGAFALARLARVFDRGFPGQ